MATDLARARLLSHCRAIRCIQQKYNRRGCKLREGFYKVAFHTAHGTGNGVIYAIAGKLRGGNTGFAFIGSYTGSGNDILARISTERHNDDPAVKPLFGTDRITLTLRGKEDGDIVDFEGSALQMPSVAFKAVLMRIAD
jgi:T3SS negative regulator,GrlR